MAKELKPDIKAPDFELQNTKDETVRLSDYRGEQVVFLVLMRGFA